MSASQIAIVNKSKRIPDDVLSFACKACDQQVIECAKAWGVAPTPVAFYSSEQGLPIRDVRIMAVVDDIDAPGALGYHDDELGVIYGRVLAQDFAATSVTLSHECLEELIDPTCDKWMPMPDGRSVALEVCLAGETEVRLANGERATMERLAASGFGAVDLLASVNGQTAPSVGRRARMTKRAADVVRVRLADGTSFRCTPDHLVMLATGAYKEAGKLIGGDVLREVTPCFAQENPADGGLAHAEAHREDVRRVAAAANGQHVGVRQYRASVVGSAPVSVAGHPVLSGGVDHVLLVRAEEQVLGIRADRFVARMADLFPVRNRALRQFERQAMNVDHGAVVPDLAVSAIVRGTGPAPATITHDHATTKGVGRRGRRGLVVVREAGVEAAVPPHARPVHPAQPLGNDLSHASVGEAHGKVVYSVEPGGKADVFDLSVPGPRNFALGAGVFVHNCDAVEADTYAVSVEIMGEQRDVMLSNYVLPKWFDPAERGGFDRMGILAKPFGMTDGGYLIVKDRAGNESNIFARPRLRLHGATSKIRAATKLTNSETRLARRLAAA